MIPEIAEHAGQGSDNRPSRREKDPKQGTDAYVNSFGLRHRLKGSVIPMSASGGLCLYPCSQRRGMVGAEKLDIDATKKILGTADKGSRSCRALLWDVCRNVFVDSFLLSPHVPVARKRSTMVRMPGAILW